MAPGLRIVTEAYDAALAPADAALAPATRAGPSETSARMAELVSLLRGTDLHPGPVVDSLFRQVVRTAIVAPADDDRNGHAEVRAVCAEGESRLEAEWARRVIADPRSVRAFPYRDNYRALARGEYLAVRRALRRRPLAVAFVGSGPLPLTAIDLHLLDPVLRITCVDHDASALAQGALVARALCRWPSQLDFRQATAEEVDYSSMDVVIVAALVGTDASAKRATLAAMARTLRLDAVLAARSVPADGRQWLYARVDAADPPPGTRVIGEREPGASPGLSRSGVWERQP